MLSNPKCPACGEDADLCCGACYADEMCGDRFLNPRPLAPDRLHMPTRMENGQLAPVLSDIAGQALWTLNDGTSIRHRNVCGCEGPHHCF